MAEEKKQDDPLDPLEQLIRSEPPSTLEEVGELAMIYIAGLEEIARVNANHPMRASEEVIVLTKRLVASLSPPGSPGPAHLFAPLMEIILALQSGVLPEQTTLFKSTPPRKQSRPPTPPAKIVGKAWVAAVLQMLMDGGLSKKEAEQRAVGRLERAGVTRNAVGYWRKKAKKPGPMNLAFLDALTRLRARITPENVASWQQVLLKTVDELVEQGLLE